MMNRYSSFRHMISQSINLKKIFLCCCSGISRPIFLSVLLITASFCHSSTTGNRDEDGALPPEEYGALSESDDTNNANDPSANKAYATDLPYDLSDPDKKYTLPKSLREVSGLAYYLNGEILCVQDEKANVYTFDLEKEEVTSTFDFGKNGDYEDVTVAGTTVYVIRSDGKIFEIEDFASEDPDVKDHKTTLSAKNNTEGLTYDPASNALLITCKESPAAKKSEPYKGFRAVYQFDLKEKDLVLKPYILVDLDRLDIHRKISSFGDFFLRIALRLHLIESKTSFYPSAIAIHPFRNEIYMISSRGKILLTLDRKGNVLDLEDLDPKTFRQPEGICFSPEGDLFISNEGKGGKGTILRFNYRPAEGGL